MLPPRLLMLRAPSGPAFRLARRDDGGDEMDGGSTASDSSPTDDPKRNVLVRFIAVPDQYASSATDRRARGRSGREA
jgi:hypothetical protein